MWRLPESRRHMSGVKESRSVFAVLVVVLAVKSVTVSIVQVIDMITVDYCFVSTILAMEMLFGGVLCNVTMLVIMIAVRSVVVAVVDVVDMVAVGYCFVSTSFTVRMFFQSVLCVMLAHESLLIRSENSSHYC